MDEPVHLSSKDYPNLDAILSGTIAGHFNNWPAVRPELIKLVAEVKRLKGENKRLKALERVIDEALKGDTKTSKGQPRHDPHNHNHRHPAPG